MGTIKNIRSGDKKQIRFEKEHIGDRFDRLFSDLMDTAVGNRGKGLNNVDLTRKGGNTWLTFHSDEGIKTTYAFSFGNHATDRDKRSVHVVSLDVTYTEGAKAKGVNADDILRKPVSDELLKHLAWESNRWLNEDGSILADRMAGYMFANDGLMIPKEGETGFDHEYSDKKLRAMASTRMACGTYGVMDPEILCRMREKDPSYFDKVPGYITSCIDAYDKDGGKKNGFFAECDLIGARSTYEGMMGRRDLLYKFLHNADAYLESIKGTTKAGEPFDLNSYIEENVDEDQRGELYQALNDVCYYNKLKSLDGNRGFKDLTMNLFNANARRSALYDISESTLDRYASEYGMDRDTHMPYRIRQPFGAVRTSSAVGKEVLYQLYMDGVRNGNVWDVGALDHQPVELPECIACYEESDNSWHIVHEGKEHTLDEFRISDGTREIYNRFPILSGMQGTEISSVLDKIAFGVGGSNKRLAKDKEKSVTVMDLAAAELRAFNDFYRDGTRPGIKTACDELTRSYMDHMYDVVNNNQPEYLHTQTFGVPSVINGFQGGSALYKNKTYIQMLCDNGHEKGERLAGLIYDSYGLYEPFMQPVDVKRARTFRNMESALIAFRDDMLDPKAVEAADYMNEVREKFNAMYREGDAKNDVSLKVRANFLYNDMQCMSEIYGLADKASLERLYQDVTEPDPNHMIYRPKDKVESKILRDICKNRLDSNKILPYVIKGADLSDAVVTVFENIGETADLKQYADKTVKTLRDASLENDTKADDKYNGLSSKLREDQAFGKLFEPVYAKTDKDYASEFLAGLENGDTQFQ